MGGMLIVSCSASLESLAPIDFRLCTVKEDIRGFGVGGILKTDSVLRVGISLHINFPVGGLCCRDEGWSVFSEICGTTCSPVVNGVSGMIRGSRG